MASLFLHPRLVLPEFPAVTAPPEAVAKIRHGNAVNLPYFAGRDLAPCVSEPLPATALRGTLVRVFADQTQLIAIARRVAGTLFQPKVVLIS